MGAYLDADKGQITPIGVPPETVTLGSLPTVKLTRDELAYLMVSDCLSNRLTHGLPKAVFSSNGQALALISQDAIHAKLMAQADYIHADGMSVVFASKVLTRNPLPERIATTDFFHNAARVASEHKLRFFILGAREDANEAACKAIREQYPDLEICGRQHGYFDRAEEEQICEQILTTGTDVLWVALGKPLQEEFSIRNRERLRGVGWIKTCGGLLDFLNGSRKRAPKWMQNAGMEWAYRLSQEPGRLAWRYATTNVLAVKQLLAASAQNQESRR